MDIVRVDPFDEAGVTAWHATVFAADMHEREYAVPWRLPEVLVAVQSGQRDREKTMFSGLEDGRVVVAGHYEASKIDTLDHAHLFVGTHPDHHRRGLGSAMLARLEQHAAEQGRTVLNAEGAWPIEAPEDGRGTAPGEFLARHGYRFGLGDIHRILPLPVDAALLDRLAAEAAPHHTAYTLRSWVGPVPDDLVQSFAALVALLMVEAPTGELEREPESADVDALRRARSSCATRDAPSSTRSPWTPRAWWWPTPTSAISAPRPGQRVPVGHPRAPRRPRPPARDGGQGREPAVAERARGVAPGACTRGTPR